MPLGLLLALSGCASGMLHPLPARDCPGATPTGLACSGHGSCFGRERGPPFAPLCICEKLYWGANCTERLLNPFPPNEVERREKWTQARSVACGADRFAASCEGCVAQLSANASLNDKKASCRGECRLRNAQYGCGLPALPAVHRIADEAGVPLVDLHLLLRPSLTSQLRLSVTAELIPAAVSRLCRFRPFRRAGMRASPPQIAGSSLQPPHPSNRSLDSAPEVGVCFSGWLGVSVAEGGKSLADGLIRPLRARVLLALTYHAADGCNSVETCELAKRLHALQPFSRVSLSPMLSLERLVEAMEGLPHWRQVLRAYNSGRVRCSKTHNWRNASDGPPYRCVDIYLGNTIFAPVLGSARLHVLRQLHDIRRCLSVISEDEAARGGRSYERVVHSRLEFIWLAPHPPLQLLHSAATWIPSGEDYYGGINDRHAVLSRAAAEVYMRRWDMILNGGIMRIDRQLRQGVISNGLSLQDENYVAALLRYFHLPIRRFP
ncbi:MAG: hypothetical protein SGPRY_013741, partial [Prymnesium sp.]